MSDNPLDPSPDDEQRVRERAYHMWEEEGRPEGRAEEYWERARELDAMTSSAGAGLQPNPMQIYGDDLPPEQPVEEASIQENLGEFPGRFTDQGDRRETPMTRAEEAEASERDEL